MKVYRYQTFTGKDLFYCKLTNMVPTFSIQLGDSDEFLKAMEKFGKGFEFDVSIIDLYKETYFSKYNITVDELKDIIDTEEEDRVASTPLDEWEK
jgi:hypothetical protein